MCCVFNSNCILNADNFYENYESNNFEICLPLQVLHERMNITYNLMLNQGKIRPAGIQLFCLFLLRAY